MPSHLILNCVQPCTDLCMYIHTLQACLRLTLFIFYEMVCCMEILPFLKLINNSASNLWGPVCVKQSRVKDLIDLILKPFWFVCEVWVQALVLKGAPHIILWIEYVYMCNIFYHCYLSNHCDKNVISTKSFRVKVTL